VRVLVTGSRRLGTERDDEGFLTAESWSQIKWLRDMLTIYLSNGGTVVHGGCPTGADCIADNLSRDLGLVGVTVERHPADWSKGRKAGPERNQGMVDLGADICLAFPLGESRGTRDCMRRARAAGIPVVDGSVA
jgi:hypothetical protein